jgi:hypothetical protein
MGKPVSKPNTEETIGMLIWGRLHAEVEGRDLVPWLISQLLATSPDLPGLRNSVLYFLQVSAEELSNQVARLETMLGRILSEQQEEFPGLPTPDWIWQ